MLSQPSQFLAKFSLAWYCQLVLSLSFPFPALGLSFPEHQQQVMGSAQDERLVHDEPEPSSSSQTAPKRTDSGTNSPVTSSLAATIWLLSAAGVLGFLWWRRRVKRTACDSPTLDKESATVGRDRQPSHPSQAKTARRRPYEQPVRRHGCHHPAWSAWALCRVVPRNRQVRGSGTARRPVFSPVLWWSNPLHPIQK